MASNEDILMQFKAKDNVSSVVKTMEANVKASMEAIRAASSDLDEGLDNLSKTSENVSKAFDNIKNNSINIDDSDVKSTEKEVENLKKDDVKLKVNSDDSEVDSLQLKLTKLKQNKIQMDLEANTAKLDQVNTKIANIQKAFKSLENPVLEPEYKEAQIKKLQSALESLEKEKINLEVKVANDELKKAKELEKELNYTAKLQLDVDGDEELSDVKSKIKNIEDDEIDLHVNNMAAMASIDQLGEGFDRLKQGAAEVGEQMSILLESAGKQETNKAFLAQAVGAEKAEAKLKDINSVVQALPGDDSILQGLLGQAVAKDASLTTDELQKMGGAAADYFAAMENFGKNSTEAFQDMNNYLMTGMTAEVERSPILANHIDKLKEATTIQERSKALQEALNEEHWGGISQQDTYNNKLQTFEGMLERGRYNLGGMFQEGAKGAMDFIMQLDDATNGTVGMGIALAGMVSPLGETVMGFGQMATGLKAIKDLDVVSYLKSIGGAVKTAGAAEDLGDIAGLAGTKQVANSTTEVVKDASAVGALAPEAAAAEGGIAATGGALSGISAAFTSMIVPLIAIAAVVAVMIPIIAGLVAEALLFMKGIQILINSLNFGGIDLTKAIEGIKQIGRALFELGIAMAAMTFASVVTAATALINGITGLINPVKTAGTMLIQAAKEMEIFKSINIDKSVPEKLKNLSQSLKSVSTAMTSLTNVVLTMALGNIMTLGGRLGTIKQAIAKAREEIEASAKEIAKLKGLPDIEQGAVDKLNKVSKSLESVSKAMDSLRSIRDNYNWDNFMQGIFGGADIQTALANVKQDIQKAATALQAYKGLPEIPEEVGTRMKKIADTLKSTSEALTALRSIRDNYNWDSFIQGLFGGLDIPGAINAAKGDLIAVGNTLASLTALPEIPDGIYTKVQRIGSSAKNVGSTLQGMQNMPFPDVINLALLPAKIASARGVLMSTSQELASLVGIQPIPDGLYTKVQRVGTSARNVGLAVQGINTIPLVGPDIGYRVKMAVGAVRSAATELSGLQGVSVAGDMNQALVSVRNAIIQLRATINSMRGGFRSAGVGIGASLKGGIRAGVAGLHGVVSSTVASGMSAGVGPAHSGGTRIGNAGKTSFQNSFKISQVASNEVSYATQAIQNGTAAFVQAVGAMAEQAVQEAKNKLDQQSPGRIARMFGAEMDFSRDLVLDRGQGIVRAARTMSDNVVNAWNMGGSQVAFTTPGLDAARLDSLRRMNQSSSMGQTQRPVAIHIGEGAIQLDARNLTTKESRQIMINAIEGLDMVSGIDLKGV